MPKALTNQVFLERLAIVNPSISPLEKYSNIRTKIKVSCKKCGFVWSGDPDALLRGIGCKMCSRKNRHSPRRLNNEVFIKELKKFNPNLESLEPYIGMNTAIKMRCKVCSYEWETRPANLISQKHKNTGCPKCAIRKQTKTKETFAEELKKVNLNITPIGEYAGSLKYMLVKCEICGHEWNAPPNDLLKGHGCPNCWKGATSFAEQFLYKSLTYLFPDVRSRDREAIGEELDIYIPSIYSAIEIGSWYWHKKRERNDALKREKCEKKGINLITIFDAYPKAKLPPASNCIVVEYDLGKPEYRDSLKYVVLEVCKRLGKNGEILKTQWDSIEQYANSYYFRNTKSFIEEMKEINPDIIILGEYAGVHDKIKCQCKRCGLEWSPESNSLLRGIGCPKCGGVLKKTHDRFLSELKETNENILPLERYKGANKKILCRCQVCGNKWLVTPHKLLGGRGCPDCARNKRSKPVICVETGVEYKSIAEASRTTNIPKASINNVCKNKMRKAGGYHWVFAKDLHREQ